jgi:hypothetical protein
MKRFFKANSSTTRFGLLLKRASALAILATVGCVQVGCSTITSPISGIPANRLPPEFLAQPKNNYVDIDISRLAQKPPRDYLLDEGDILGVYIEGILPFTPPGEPPQLPPVNFPDSDSTLPPSVGYPVTVLGDGTITLPLVGPMLVKDMTVEQVRDLIRRKYLDAKILKEDENRILSPIVSLISERTYDIIVVRQDIGTGRGQQRDFQNDRYLRGSDESASGSRIKLVEGQNDILNALMASGGLPGINAKNQIKVLKSGAVDQAARDAFIREFYEEQQRCLCSDPYYCPPPLPDDPAIMKIPLRLPPGVIPDIQPEDVVLEDGDIIYIESREAEVFYTGGLLPGGEFPIPRDYDLDVLGAIALSGAGIASASGGGGGGGLGGGLARGLGTVPPGNLFILRPLPCNGQITIHVDLAEALTDPRSRPLIQPGDTLILRFKPEEELLNFGIGTFFTFGIQQLLRGN